MDIYADVRCLQDPNYAFRGIGYHSATLLSTRKDHAPQSRFIGLMDLQLPELPNEYQGLFDVLQPWSRATCVTPQSIFLQMSPMTHNQAACGRLLDRSQILSAAVIYDFIPLDAPDRYLNSPAALREYAAALLWLDAYDLFAPISVYAENRLLELADVDRIECNVTGVILREHFQAFHVNRHCHSQPISEVSDSKHERPYFLFVGGGDPRKNIDLVLAAHASLCARGIDTDLVVVGSYSDTARKTHSHPYKSLNVSSRNIRYLRDISDSELASLYSNALATICSSHTEGFSLPVIEAIACGSPVLASDCQAHCELISDPATRFRSTDASALIGLMQKVCNDPNYRTCLINNQRDVPIRFYRNKVAARFWSPILTRYNQQFGKSNQSPNWYHHSYALPSLAILSPFPPDRSGVADYTKRTVEALVGKAVVDVFTDVEHPDECSSVNQFFNIDDWAYLSEKYDRVLSVVGNSQFHTKIIDLQRAYGGPCLIHDNRLAELYAWWKGPEYFRRMACKSFDRPVSNDEAQGWLRDTSTLPGIFFDDLIECSNPLIVHSSGIQRQVLKQYGVHAECLPFCCYRTFESCELTPTARYWARERLGMKDDGLHIITLGIVAPSKAPESCLEALAQVRKHGVQAHLHFVGTCDKLYRNVLLRKAQEQRLLESVHFSHEWIDEATYRDYIIAADFAIQLRNHFFGGLSGALLDCICAGLPTVANMDLAQALDAPETVLRISDKLQSTEVSQAIFTGVANECHRDRILPSRQRYIDDHSFDRYSDSLLNVLNLRSRSAYNQSRVAA